MDYEDNNEMGAALKIINRLLDKVDAHENRQERERIEKMLIDNSKPMPLQLPGGRPSPARDLLNMLNAILPVEGRDEVVVPGAEMRLLCGWLAAVANGEESR